MIKTDIKAYKVVVSNDISTATLICVTYRISVGEPHYGAEFYELVTSFKNSFQVPYGSHSYSFQEELRTFATAAAITPTGRQGINEWITQKMKTAYGEKSNVVVENFPS